jgi:hypothetical protein
MSCLHPCSLRKWASGERAPLRPTSGRWCARAPVCPLVGQRAPYSTAIQTAKLEDEGPARLLTMSTSSSEEELSLGAPVVRGFDELSGSFETATVLEKRPRAASPAVMGTLEGSPNPPAMVRAGQSPATPHARLQLPPLRLPTGATVAIDQPVPPPSRTAARRAVGYGPVRRWGPIVVASLASFLLGLLLRDRPARFDGSTVTLATLPVTAPARAPVAAPAPEPATAPATDGAATSAPAVNSRVRGRSTSAGKAKATRSTKKLSPKRTRARGRSR